MNWLSLILGLSALAISYSQRVRHVVFVQPGNFGRNMYVPPAPPAPSSSYGRSPSRPAPAHPPARKNRLVLHPLIGPLPVPTTVYNKLGLPIAQPAPPAQDSGYGAGGGGGGPAPAAGLPKPETVEQYGGDSPAVLNVDECYLGGCWDVEEGSTMVAASMFQRVSNISCADCLQACQATWEAGSLMSQRFCQAAVYDADAQLCDHFDVSPASSIASAAPFASRAIFTPKSASGCSSPLCPEGQVLRLGACYPNTFEPRSEKVRATGLLTGIKPAPNYNAKGFGMSEGMDVVLDPKCFAVRPNAAAVNAVPFARQTDIGYMDCADLCTENFKSEGEEYGCRSFVYDHRWALCDLYAVDSTLDAAGNCFVAPYRGRDYVVPLPDCRDAPYTTPAPEEEAACTIEDFVAAPGLEPDDTASEDCPPSFGTPVGAYCVHVNDEARDACSADQYCADNGGFLPTQITDDELDTLYLEELSDFLGPDAPTLFFTDGFNDQQVTAWKSTLLPSELSGDVTGKGDCVALDALDGAIVRTDCAEKLPTLCLRRFGGATEAPEPGEACPPLDLPDGSQEEQESPKEDLAETMEGSEEECLERCTEMGSGCLSFVRQEDGNCLLYSTGIEFDRGLEDFPASDYYQRICLPVPAVKNTELVYDIWPQKVLIGFAIKEVAARSLKECMLLCLDNEANEGFTCNSAMYYPTEQLNSDGASCILNEETREAQEDLFIEETLTAPMYYFDVGRGPGITAPLRLKLAREQNRIQEVSKNSRRSPGQSLIAYAREQRTLDAKPKTSLGSGLISREWGTPQWSEWSDCGTSTTGLRFRYKPCPSKRLYKCPRQFALCKDELVKLMGVEDN